MTTLINLVHLKKSELIDLILNLKNQKSELEMKIKEVSGLVKEQKFNIRDKVNKLTQNRINNLIYNGKIDSKKQKILKNNKWKESEKKKVIILRDIEKKDFPEIGKLMCLSNRQSRKLYATAKHWEKNRKFNFNL